MKPRIALCSCLALLALLCGVTAAEAAYRVPFEHARWPHVTVAADPTGPTALVAVHNTDDDPVDIVVRINRPDGTSAWTRPFVLDPKQTRTWNLRDLQLPYSPTADYPGGVFTGSIEVTGERHVLIGDVLPVDPSRHLAEGNQLLPHREHCASTCDHFVLRYMQGGAFSGGTNVQVLRERHPSSSGIITGQFYDEPGNDLGGFTLANRPLSFQFDVADQQPPQPFGTLYLDNVTTGAVTATYRATGSYSVGLEAWCIPECNPCDARGPCFDEGNPICGSGCVAADLQLSGSATCTVGAPFAAILSATGTQHGAITCTALPSGLVRTGNTITGTCNDAAIANFTCSVENECGEDSVTIPVLDPTPFSTSLALLKTVQTKGCAPAGGTAPVSFTISVTNTGSGAAQVNVTDAATPACNRSNLAMTGGQTVTYTCEGPFGAGAGSNTAVASVPGTSSTATSTVSFSVSECPANCAGVGSSAFSFDIVGQTATDVTVRSLSTFPAEFTGRNDMLVPAPSSGFPGGAVTSGAAYDSTYRRPGHGQSPMLVNGALNVSRQGEVCVTVARNVQIPPQPPAPTCGEFTPPAITLTPNVTTTDLQVIVNSIAANPTGGTFAPNPPQTYNRPAAGSPAETKTFTYTLQYTPVSGLSCTTQKTVEVQVPPRPPAPTCGQYTPPAITLTPNVTTTDLQVIVNSIAANPSGGTFAPNPPQTYNRPPAGSPAETKTFTYTLQYTPVTGLSCSTQKTVEVQVPPRPPAPTCGQFTPPAITLTPNVTTTALQVIVNSIAANPAGGVFAPNPPQTYERPANGSPAQTKTFVYTLQYTPVTGLSCTTQKTVDVPVPPRAACSACEGKVSRLDLEFLSDEGKTVKVTARHGSTDVTVFNAFVAAGGGINLVGPPSSLSGFDGTLGTEIKIYLNGSFHTTIHTSCSQPIGPGLTSGQFLVLAGESKQGGTLCAVCTSAPGVTTFAVNSSGDTLTGSAAVRNAGEWDLVIAATSSESECNAAQYDHPEKDHDEAILGCGSNDTLAVSYDWSDHGDEWWRVTLRRNGQIWQQSACIRNNRN